MKWVLNPRIPVTAGIVVLAACLLALLLVPRSWTEILREQAFDLVFSAEQQIRPHVDAGSDARVVVVDIDRHSIEVVGAWPWPRETLARLIEAVAAAEPAAIAVDILFAEPDTRSPAALARRLGALTGRSDLALLADELIDGDKRLAETLRRVPVALGFVLDPDGTGVVLGTPVIASSPLPLRGLWSAAGAVGPVSTLEQAADGTGALSLPGMPTG